MNKEFAERGDATRKDMLDFIIQFMMEHGYSPSIREIKEGVYIGSTANVCNHLRVLKQQGKITMQPGQSRTIAVVGYEYRKVEKAGTMNEYLVFLKKSLDVEKLITDFNLHHILTNDRTAIYENKDMRVSIDEMVIRVLVFKRYKRELTECVKEYFYNNCMMED